MDDGETPMVAWLDARIWKTTASTPQNTIVAHQKVRPPMDVMLLQVVLTGRRITLHRCVPRGQATEQSVHLFSRHPLRRTSEEGIGRIRAALETGVLTAVRLGTRGNMFSSLNQWINMGREVQTTSVAGV
jgi:hypothetical protein